MTAQLVRATTDKACSKNPVRKPGRGCGRDITALHNDSPTGSRNNRQGVLKKPCSEAGRGCGDPVLSQRMPWAKWPLHKAAKAGNCQAVEALLRLGHEINTRDKYGRTPIWYAADAGFDETVMQLAGKGASVDVKDKEGDYPLVVAVRKRHQMVVRVLLANIPDYREKSCMAALMVAASGGDEGMVGLMIAIGVSARANDRENFTALHEASYMGHKGVVQLLLKHGADAGAEDSTGNTPLSMAALGDQRLSGLLSIQFGEIMNMLRNHDPGAESVTLF